MPYVLDRSTLGSWEPEITRLAELHGLSATRSCASSCYACDTISAHGGDAGHNPLFCQRYPIGACVTRKTIPSGVLVGCEASETKVSLILRGGNEIARERCDC